MEGGAAAPLVLKDEDFASLIDMLETLCFEVSAHPRTPHRQTMMMMMMMLSLASCVIQTDEETKEEAMEVIKEIFPCRHGFRLATEATVLDPLAYMARHLNRIGQIVPLDAIKLFYKDTPLHETLVHNIFMMRRLKGREELGEWMLVRFTSMSFVSVLFLQ